ncbi:hypothetical protein ACQ86N_34895 [Puia sp. P3]|uniref:hypothetical protein n=1 Tax=Puia sp. P3 TaxID=3423952 RepID=UPI003D66E6BB
MGSSISRSGALVARAKLISAFLLAVAEFGQAGGYGDVEVFYMLCEGVVIEVFVEGGVVL